MQSNPSPTPIKLLEIAVTSVERATAAERAGAHRLELCEQLQLGGLTPELELIRQVRSAVQLPIHVLVRPRPGNFVYTPQEFAHMKETIAALRHENLQGIVTGALLPDGIVDMESTKQLVTIAGPLEVTFHRAFDETRDLSTALEAVILTGAHRILTSGGAPDAPRGAAILDKLIQQAGHRITILPGGGLHAGNIADLACATHAREFHTGLGSTLPYDSQNLQAFEFAVRNCVTVVAAAF